MSEKIGKEFKRRIFLLNVSTYALILLLSIYFAHAEPESRKLAIFVLPLRVFAFSIYTLVYFIIISVMFRRKCNVGTCRILYLVPVFFFVCFPIIKMCIRGL